MSFEPSMGGGFRFFTMIFPFIFLVVFLLIIGLIIYSIVTFAKNKSAPKKSEYARVIAKRTEVRSSSNHHHNDMHHSSSSRTYYYITLEFDNGHRQEFLDVRNLYGLVAEGDTGYALTQGEWIVAFERNNGSEYATY